MLAIPLVARNHSRYFQQLFSVQVDFLLESSLPKILSIVEYVV